MMVRVRGADHHGGVVGRAEPVDGERLGLHIVRRVQGLVTLVPRPHWGTFYFLF